MKEKSDFLKNTLILFVITLTAAVLLGIVYEITKEPVSKQQEKRKNDAYAEVFPGLSEVRESAGLSELAAGYAQKLEEQGISRVAVKEAYLVAGASGEILGYVMTVDSKNGYGGLVEFAMGVDREGTLKGISFLSLSETPGLGMNAKEESFLSQFKDVRTKSFGFAKKKIEGDTPVDGISSASITTKAVTLGVNAGLLFADDAEKAGMGGN